MNDKLRGLCEKSLHIKPTKNVMVVKTWIVKNVLDRDQNVVINICGLSMFQVIWGIMRSEVAFEVTLVEFVQDLTFVNYATNDN